ncbi:hypothetical protein [Stutzerimonas decontaminans]|uniref:hypothetical protein n=1 Tax=Stutzerimonas decontaminans TaxID=3022791 RepID=UPI000AC8D6DE|nr:hypothetical protein [Stutzerimonas decontaminans]MCQ4243839.1 hypothetical protein [Stutzerimonas decontaminans]
MLVAYLDVCRSDFTNALGPGLSQNYRLGKTGESSMLKFIGGTAGIIFIIGLIVVIGIFKLLF